MVTIGMNYKVLPGKGETFVNACNGVIRAMEKIDGHTTSALYRDVNDEGTFLIVSDWESKEAFDEFIASEAFRNVANWGKEQILAGRPSHTVYSH